MMLNIIHESMVEPINLPGRTHKVLAGPEAKCECKSMVFGTSIYPPESRMPTSIHKSKDKIIYVLNGYGVIYIDESASNFEQGSCIIIRKNHRYSIKNDSAGAMKVVYAMTPAQFPDETNY
jgi:mannose-6-phosphate isomerase-like protein (cupin superfamily)